MALKENWVDKVDGVDDVIAKDINSIAQSVIDLENKFNEVNDNIPAVLQTLGDSETDAMSQKAVTKTLMHTVIRANELSWEQCSLSSGENSAATNRISSGLIGVNTVDKRVQILLDTTKYDIFYSKHDASGKFIEQTNWLVWTEKVTSPIDVTLADDVAYLRLCIRRMTNGDIAPDEDTGLVLLCSAIARGVGTSDKLVMSQKSVSELVKNIAELDQILLKKANVNTTQGGLYIGDSQNLKYVVTWEHTVDDTMSITIPNKIAPRYPNFAVAGLAWEDISANIADCISINGAQATITIAGFGKRLVLNSVDRQLYIRNCNDADPNDIVLIVNGYGSPCGGELMRYIENARFKDIETDIANANDAIESLKSNAPSAVDDATRTKIQSFATMFNNTDNIESFLFFTDPHLTQFRGDAWRPQFYEFMGHLKSVFDEAPVTRVFCGGDWLGNRELPSDACYRLGLIDSTMRAKFGERYHHAVGNHDYNSYGCSEDGAAMGTGVINAKTIRNLWYRNIGKNYYKIESQNTDFYVFDSQDSEGFASQDYAVEQAKWFAECLQSNTRDNIAIISHFTITQILNVAKQFNARGTLVIGETTYDFTSATGKVRFWMQGHQHEDMVLTDETIPVILTTHMRDGGVPTYDLCLADYDANKLHLVRIGTGEDRTINI